MYTNWDIEIISLRYLTERPKGYTCKGIIDLLDHPARVNPRKGDLVWI